MSDELRERRMIVDLHAHYAMHLVEELHPNPLRALRSALSPASDARVNKFRASLSSTEEQQRFDRHRGRRRRRAILRSLFSWINATLNYRSPASGPGVTVELMKKGGVGVVLSPLLDPFNEFGSLPGWILAALIPAAVGGLLILVALVVWGAVALLRWHTAVAVCVAHIAGYLLLIGLALLLFALLVVAALAILNWRASRSALDELPGSPPREEYFQDLLFQLERVEDDIFALRDWARVAHNYDELTEAREAGKIAVIHCVEGGFQLGDSQKSIERHVAQLAERGVAYVTVAHLFFRRIATNAPAIPVLSDGMYRFLARQPSEGLTELGEAAIRAMFCNGILIDVTHMSEPAICETLALLEELEEKYDTRPVPVLATHIACRFGTYEYNLSDATISEIGKRNGLMGVIFCDHWMHDGPSKDAPRGERETFERMKANIDRIAGIIKKTPNPTQSPHRCTAIGSDLDGFIKPMLRGLENMAGMAFLEERLRTEYGPDADLILSENALRVLKSAWRKPKCNGKTH